MGSQHPDQIDFAGDYNLKGIILQNHAGTGGNFPDAEGGVNIQSLVQELNIYEGIEQSAVYGTLIVLDSTNLIGNLPIQGTERLMFRLSTPGTSKIEHIIDASEESGHPFYVYKVSNKRQVSEGTLMYTIHFGSREFMRNLRFKVSQSYDGKLSSIVNQIFGDKDGLDSRKKLYYEETGNSDTIVMPNVSPFQAINLVAKRSIPKNTKGVGYYFYETTKGFYFQSWENMCADYGGREKAVVQQFFYMPQNITDPEITEPKEIHDLKSVESYEFLNTFHDTAAAQAVGTYGHRVITHNLYNKSYKIDDWHYHNQFGQFIHADHIDDSPSDSKPAIRSNPVDFDINPDGTGKGVSDYPESLVTLIGTNQYQHNTVKDEGGEGGYGTNVEDDGVKEGIRNAITQQRNIGTAIKLIVKGQTYIQPGHIIDFNIRPVEEQKTTVDNKSYDPQYSGRYVVTKIRHRVTKTDYKMVLEGRKDSVREQLPGKTNRNFHGIPLQENAGYQSLTDSNYASIAATGKQQKYGL